ncbi:hypothetical protein MJO29_003018 [Puccinia striiformis f. sp. tritici]|nr:hypothetical protein MJO29_003018 [Puccinia striiformis f. sp. tritici]
MSPFIPTPEPSVSMSRFKHFRIISIWSCLTWLFLGGITPGVISSFLLWVLHCCLPRWIRILFPQANNNTLAWCRKAYLQLGNHPAQEVLPCIVEQGFIILSGSQTFRFQNWKSAQKAPLTPYWLPIYLRYDGPKVEKVWASKKDNLRVKDIKDTKAKKLVIVN